jgi:hypothetical protein
MTIRTFRAALSLFMASSIACGATRQPRRGFTILRGCHRRSSTSVVLPRDALPSLLSLPFIVGFWVEPKMELDRSAGR